jgi:GNAT superfamily N-acetyltransferase
MEPLPKDIRIRTMQDHDRPACMRLKNAADWNQADDDWTMMLGANPKECFVAESGGAVVGSVVIVRHDPSVAWISMLLVDPDRRGRGIGTALFGHALEVLNDCPSIWLDATPAGRRLYEPLGFRPVDALTRHVAASCGVIEGVATDGVRRMDDADLMAILELDHRVFGTDRSIELRAFRDRLPACAVMIERDGDAAGYGLARPGTRFTHVGPLVAPEPEQAFRLAAAVLAGLEGRAVGMDVFDRHTVFAGWLRSLGFAPERPFTRMVRGRILHAGHPAMQIASAGPEFG